MATPTPSEVRSILESLAFDLRWTWCHEADALWMRIDPERWAQTQNPLAVLRALSERRLGELAAGPSFVAQLQVLNQARAAYSDGETWFHKTHPGTDLSGVAFFSMEFGLGEALPIYAGGLGVLAGDLLKTASDLGLPLIGVGLLYQSGYFRQKIDAAGHQLEIYPSNDPASLPLQPARDPDGKEVRVAVEFPGRTLTLRVWQATVGRTKLYLLDSNDPANSISDRGITARLYDGAAETRLQQEIVLGVGGWRTVRAVSPRIDVCHLNEGHPAFLILERAISVMRAAGLSFRQALWATRAGNVFTTHTPVGAGFDRFPLKLLAPYISALYDGTVDMAEILALGCRDTGNDGESFNMAYLALRGSGTAFGVSRRHGAVSRQLFQPLFPRLPAAEMPIGHVTNGVHIPSWDSALSDALWTASCGKDRWRLPSDDLPASIQALPDPALWEMRALSRGKLVSFVRARLKRQLAERGLDQDSIEAAGHVLDPNILTFGFARRFTGYKRSDLLLRDTARLCRILNHHSFPAQLVIAGKAHPDDRQGKEMIREWVMLAQRPEFRSRLVFLEDYDLTLAQELVQGVDVWINTPRRPWEACGTSGMKVLVNGGLNLSELDGWWEEAYAPDNGWAIGDLASAFEPDIDRIEAAELYDVIERQVAPEFYDRDGAGMAMRWLARARRSMATLTAQYSSNRTAREYLDRAYLPAAQRYDARTADDCRRARSMEHWAERLIRSWSNLHIGEPIIVSDQAARVVSVAVYFGEIDQSDVAVELYADAEKDGMPVALRMVKGDALPGATNGNIYSLHLDSGRPDGDFTVRIVPTYPGVALPAELPLIAWQR